MTDNASTILDRQLNANVAYFLLNLILMVKSLYATFEGELFQDFSENLTINSSTLKDSPRGMGNLNIMVCNAQVLWFTNHRTSEILTQQRCSNT